MVMKVERGNTDYVKDLIYSYSDDRPHISADEYWGLIDGSIKDIFVCIIDGKLAGSIWTVRWLAGKEFYTLEGHRDKRFIRDVKESGRLYLTFAKLCLLRIKQRPLYISCREEERYAKVVARSLGFVINYKKDGELLYELR